MVVEYPSVKPTGFTINGSGDKSQYSFQLKGIANTVVVTGAANSTTHFSALTYSTAANLVKFTHTRININAQGGADFNDSGNGTDRVYPNSITIEANTPYDRDFLADRTTTNSKVGQTAEPQRSGQPEITVTLGFPEMVALTDLLAFQNETMKKMEIYMYSSASASAKFQFPNLQPLQPTADISGVGRIPQTLVYRALDCATAPSGMTGITEPMRITLINSVSSAYDT
jgi:hypothetical protein